MPNYDGNPNIAKYGKNTRFGAGVNCPRKAQEKASAPWSIRRMVRIIAGMTVADFKEMAKNIENLTAAQAIAVTKYKKALSGDTKAMQQITEAVDGKLTKGDVHQSKITLEDLVVGSLEYDDEFRK